MQAKDRTDLARFLREQGIGLSELAREAGFSRVHLHNVRAGKVEPSRQCIAAVTGALCRITNKRVRPEDVFDLQSTRRAS
jgi:predicted transcriptional regulator